MKIKRITVYPERKIGDIINRNNFFGRMLDDGDFELLRDSVLSGLQTYLKLNVMEILDKSISVVLKKVEAEEKDRLKREYLVVLDFEAESLMGGEVKKALVNMEYEIYKDEGGRKCGISSYSITELMEKGE